MPMSKDEMRAYQQARRERRRAQTKNQAPEIEGAPPHSLTNVQADQLAAAQAEIESLQAEVAMLKRQLAERPQPDRAQGVPAARSAASCSGAGPARRAVHPRLSRPDCRRAWGYSILSFQSTQLTHALV